MPSKRETLRKLLAGQEQFIATGTLTVLTARIAQRAGLPALYVGAPAIAALHRAAPDYGVLEPPELIAVAAQIAHGVSIPTIADAGGLGGNVGSVFRWTREYERAGLAGIVMHDEAPPHAAASAPSLIATGDMHARIRAAVTARTDPSFVIAARCHGDSTDALIGRAQAYADAGADSFVVADIVGKDIAAVADALHIPCSAVVAGPAVPPDARMVISTGWEIATAANFYFEGAEEYRRAGQVSPERRKRTTGFYSLLEEDEYLGVITDWTRSVRGAVGDAWRAMQ